MYEVTGCLV